MKHFRNNNHYTTYGWMLDKLGLRDARLTIYAIVYSFSQDGETEYYGGRKYMAEASGRSLPTVDRVLAELEKDGLIKKCDRVNDGVSHCRYSVYLDENGEGIINPNKEENDNNTPYYDNNTPPYYDNKSSLLHKDNNKDNNNKNKDNNKEKSPEELEHDRWFAKYFPVLSKNKRPLKLKTYIALQANYTKDEILMKLNEMEAKSDFNRKYSDVGRVLLVWLKRDKEWGRIKPKEKQNERTSK